MALDVRFLGAALAHIEQEDPETMVRDAVDLCRVMVEEASEELARIRTIAGGRADEEIDEVKAAYDASKGKAFRLLMGWNSQNPESTLRKLAKRLDEVFRRIDRGLTVKCRPSYGRGSGLCSDGDASAYSNGNVAGGKKTVNICPQYFDSDDPVWRASVIAHEICHAIGDFGGTRDQTGPDGETVYGKERAMEFARVEPDKACKSPENVEQLLYYRERLKDTAEFIPIGSSIWAGVPDFPDAAVEMPDWSRVFFKGNQFWRFDNTTGTVSGPFRVGPDGWNGIPDSPDGAIRTSINQVTFYKGPAYAVFDSRPEVNRIVETGTRPSIGTWLHLLEGVDAAVTVPNAGEALLFKKTLVQRLDLSTNRINGTRRIWDLGFRDSADLYGHFDAVVTTPDRRFHFFTAGHVQSRASADITWD